MSAEVCREIILERYRERNGIDLLYWEVLEELPLSFYEINKERLLRIIGRGEEDGRINK